jgi:hypothetical protein
MRRGRPKHLGPGSVIVAVALATVLEMAAAAPFEPPSADEIVRKFLAMRASAPNILSADASVALRVNAPVTAPPTCVYIGKLNSTGARYAITIEREVRNGLVCGLASAHRDNLMEVVRETMEAAVPPPERAQAIEMRPDQFDMAVRDQKVVGVGQHSHWFYLLDGKAKDPKNDPRVFHGWIDYDEGLWQEGTLTYSWGQVETKLQYTRLENFWVLTYQYLYSKQYNASFEVTFTNFQFAR